MVEVVIMTSDVGSGCEGDATEDLREAGLTQGDELLAGRDSWIGILK